MNPMNLLPRMNPANLLPRMNPANLLKSRAWLELSASWRRKGGDRLELWLPRNWPAEDSELRWRRVAAGGAVQQGAQRGLEGLAPAEEVVVWTPAAETLFLRARLPTRSAAKIVQALPFALEEQLIEPPESLHFAFAHEADGALAVAVTRRERMESWLAALAAAGLAPTRLAPVTLSLPLADRAWTLSFVDGAIVLRGGGRGRGRNAHAPHEELSGNPRDPRSRRADAPGPGGPERAQRHRSARGHAFPPRARCPSDRARIAPARARRRICRSRPQHPAG